MIDKHCGYSFLFIGPKASENAVEMYLKPSEDIELNIFACSKAMLKYLTFSKLN